MGRWACPHQSSGPRITRGDRDPSATGGKMSLNNLDRDWCQTLPVACRTSVWAKSSPTNSNGSFTSRANA